MELFERAGWLIRADRQFHWHNRRLCAASTISSPLCRRASARRSARSGRRRSTGLEVEHVTGAAITEAHWDAFWAFYQDTGARKWGRPYLTRALLLAARRADGRPGPPHLRACADGRPIAGALNLIGADALYGRYWGTIEEVPHLHFEICYYQAIEAAIARGLARVEAGAQGPHKLSRGYRAGADLVGPSYRRSAASATRSPTISTPSGRRCCARSTRSPK